jgi:ribosomal protein L11 methylase PrmA
LTQVERVAGSYRDRRGYVFASGHRILRSVDPVAAEVLRGFMASSLFAKLVNDGRLVATKVAPDDPAALGIGPAALLLEHARIPFVSYPYEWPFAALRAAALLHLNLHLDLLEHGYTLTDASAYNIQFRGPEPVFIDIPSIDRYVEGAYWNGHRQFCDQFLAPLLFSARLGVPYNALYRGRLEGIPASELTSLLRLRDKLSLPVLLNVVLPARFEAAARRGRLTPRRVAARRPLPKSALRHMLTGLRRWIARLSPPARHTDWTSYASRNTYQDAERAAKSEFVARAVRAAAPRSVLDLGCNTGDYSAVALGAGAGYVIGVEADEATADLAFLRARREKLGFLPIVQDAANPSPAQGWLGTERLSFAARADFDFLVALAVEHHLAIGRNIPLDQVVRWMVGLAPAGVIEFVQKTDATVRGMLSLREDIFADYTEESFRRLLAASARIVDSRTVSEEGRVLLWYDRAR